MSDSQRPKITSFEDLIAWQRARALARDVNLLCESEPLSRKFSFRDQLQRAAVSTMSNIAEGFDRGSRAEFHHMLSISKGSCAEVRSLLYVAVDAKFIDEPTFKTLSSQTHEVSRLIGALRASVGRQRDQDRAAR
ncbi:MAG: four helix bundle protein [Anaerolinea sp.]|nr:four helix bundle protein [Anaerolinea sp.]